MASREGCFLSPRATLDGHMHKCGAIQWRRMWALRCYRVNRLPTQLYSPLSGRITTSAVRVGSSRPSLGRGNE